MAADWRAALLKQIGAPVTQNNLRFLSNWQRWEGGHTNNDARFNWLNTTRDAPGAVKEINSVGVKAFDNFQHGVAATAATLQSGRYKDIVRALVSGDPYTSGSIQAGLSTWLSGTPDSKAGAAYAAKVLGQSSPPQDVKGKAQAAYQSGPANVVNSPSPRDLMAQYQQQASQAIMTAGTSDWFGAMMGLATAKKNLNAAAANFAASEQNAREYGGTTQGVSVNPGEMQGASDQVRTILAAADAQVGKPYVWGAESPNEGGFDCSGLIDWSFRQAGINLPGRLTTYTAAKMGVSVRGKPYKPGDWLITNNGKHMVMYVGNGKVIAAPRTGETVQYQDVGRFADSIVDVRRVLK